MDLLLHEIFRSLIDKAEKKAASPVNYFFSNVAIGIALRRVYAWEQGKEDKTLLGDPVTGSPVRFVTRDWVFNLKVCSKVDFRRKNIEKEVNNWAEEESKGLLQDFLCDGWIHASTIFMSGAVLHVEGKWKDPFLASDTKKDKFYLADGKTVKVPFMTTKRKQYLGAYSLHGIPFKVLKLQFEQGTVLDDRTVLDDHSLFIVLPNNKDDFKDLQHYLGVHEKWFFDVFSPPEPVEVSNFLIPRFQVSYRPKGREFSRAGSLYRYSMFTKGVINVNECGATPAGVGLVSIRLDSGTPSPAQPPVDAIYNTLPLDGYFVANHQFMYFIRGNKYKRMWFNGAVFNPLPPISHK